ncbi:MAG TPA: helix-turn-helix domain-containing protein [Actinomycetes bacterium]|nr:helix-turn-helix domain-containing protein [Actinomycetes bacterium]
MRKRADDVALTRQRIIEAAVRLHGTIGPAATTVSALAEEAEVTRLTVYRHFPDDLSLFSACSQHWAAGQTFPDPEQWMEIDDGLDRLRAALADVYRFYRHAEPMLTNVRRDRDVLPEEILQRTAETEASYCDAVLNDFSVKGRQRALLRAAVSHALNYWTWYSLCIENKLSNAEATRLMMSMTTPASAV